MNEGMQTAANCGLPTQEFPPICAKSSLTRKRFGELTQLGLIASEELTKHGLQRSEYCEFGRIMEKIMQLE